MQECVRNAVAIVACSLLLAGLGGCDEAPDADRGRAASRVPTQAELDKLVADGPLPAAREASKLELWQHYKLMQATGMVDALGGEDQAIAALAAVSAAFERSAMAAQTDVPRMIRASFDGNGMSAGVVGVGMGLFGGMVTGGMFNGNMSEGDLARLMEQPFSVERKDGSARVEVTQGTVDTTLEQKVNEDGLTGTVKTRIHMDACPDADGKLVVTIDSESQMSAAGLSGAVKLNFRYERWLDDDAHLTDESASDLRNEMSGTGAAGNKLGLAEHVGWSRDGKAIDEVSREQGHSIFRPDEVANTQKLRQSTQALLILTAEAMLQGMGGKPAWESGRCVDLKVRSDPAKRTGARPNTAYTLFAEPRSKLDGTPTRGTVAARLDGASSLNPTDKVKADARFDYANPDKKDQTASVAFEARSRRGVGRATLEFDTRDKRAYRVAGGQNDFHVDQVVCSLSEPFDLKSTVGITMHMSGGDGSGNYTVSGRAAGVTWSGNGRYTVTANGDGGSLNARGTTTIASPVGRFSDSVAPTFTLTPVDEGCGR